MGEDIKKNCLSLETFTADSRAINIEDTIYLRQVASLYGANASGKSNVLKSLESMHYNIMGNRNLQGERFIFDARLKDKPIYCELCFSLPDSFDANDGKSNYSLYRYGYMIGTDEQGKANKVISEWLKKRPVYSLATQMGDWDSLEFEDDYDVFHRKNGVTNFYGYGDNLEKETKDKAISLNDKTLILSLFMGKDISTGLFGSVAAWLKNITFIQSELFDDAKDEQRLLTELAKRVKNDGTFKEKLKFYLNRFDDVIREIDVQYDVNSGDDVLMIVHTAWDGNREIDHAVPIFKESSGTRRMAGTYQYFCDVMDKGGLLLIDEIDIKFHPKAISHIVESFNEPSNQTAQLIFSTHNLILLEKEEDLPLNDIRFEEKYFVQKYAAHFGKSKLGQLTKELVEESLKAAEEAQDKKSDATSLGESKSNLAKLYLTGHFGAIPINNLSI
jgi:hypothetical protein